MRKRNLSPEFIFYIFIFLFPILPEYCIVLKRPIYDWVILIEVLIFLFTHKHIRDKKLIKICMIGFVLYFVTYGIHGEWTTIMTVFVECFMVILIIYNESNTISKMRKVLNVLISGGFLLCLEGLVEYFFKFNIFSIIQTTDPTEEMGALSLGYRYGHVRIEGSFGQCLPFAMYLLFINGITLYMMQTHKNSVLRYRKFYVITYILSIICIYLTTARLVFALAVVLQCLFVALYLKPEKKLIIFAFCFLAGIIVIFTTRTMITDVFYSVLAIFNPKYYNYLSDGGQNVAYRLQLFSKLSAYIKKNIFFGIGYAEKSNLTFFIDTQTSSWYAHSIDNNYLSWLVEYGAIGVISNIYIIMVALYICVKARRNKKIADNSKSFSWFKYIIILYAINLMSVYQMGEKRIFYVIVGLIFSMYRIKNYSSVTILERNQ